MYKELNKFRKLLKESIADRARGLDFDDDPKPSKPIKKKDQDLEELNQIQKTIENILITK